MQVKVKFVGETESLKQTRALPSGIPSSYIDAMNELEKITADNRNKTFYIMIGYSGRKDINKVVYYKLKAVSENMGSVYSTDDLKVFHGLNLMQQFSNVNEDYLLKFLDVPHSFDIIIRSGGENRLSDFLLYQSAYAELFFVDKLFPELEKSDLEIIMKEFEERKRKFGQ